MRTFLIILLGTLSLLLPRSGWSHDLYFRHYTNKQGLSHNTVYCALQDKKGFMWFGTDDGLNRFDGHQFRAGKSAERQDHQPFRRFDR